MLARVGARSNVAKMSCGPGYKRAVIIRLSASCEGCVGDHAGRIITGERSVARKISLSGSIEP